MKLIQGNSKQAQELFPQITELLELLTPKDDKHHLDIWYGCSVTDEIDRSDQIEVLRLEISFFQNLLRSLRGKEKSTELREVEILEEFLSFFEHYETSDLELPGANKTIAEISNSIRTEITKYEALTARRDNLSSCIAMLADLCKFLQGAIEAKIKYKHLLIEHGETIKETAEGITEEEFDQMLAAEKFNEKWTNFYEKELHKLGIETGSVEDALKHVREKSHIKTLNHLIENQLIEKIEELTKRTKRLDEELQSAERSLGYVTEQIKRLQKLEEHPYLPFSDKIDRLLNKVLALEQKLGIDFNRRIKDLVARKPGNTKEDKHYQECVAYFLAEKVPFVRHGIKEHRVSKIDMIRGVVITNKGKHIGIKRLGTGQSQSAYLTGRLNVSDDRHTIALFDEVAMMDRTSLEPIKKRFKELYADGRLFCGMIVQKSDETESWEDLT